MFVGIGESKTCSILTVAVAVYSDREDRDILAEVGRSFAELFDSPAGAHVVSSALLTPRVGKDELDRGLATWGAREADVGLLLWTSHGERDQKVAQLAVSETWIYAPVLAYQIRDYPFRRWLIIIDTCFAASVMDQLYPVLADVAKRQENGSCVLIGSSDETDPADAGVFTNTLIKVLKEGPERGWWGNDDFLEVDAVNKRLDELLPDGVGGAVLMTSGRRPGRAFPNPLYRTAAFPWPLDEPDHFLERAQGIEPGTSGWFFTGRVEALIRIVSWLNQPGEGFFVVTGPAGTGKSAIIGRVVTLSVREYREQAERDGVLVSAVAETLPALGSVTAAFHAREKRVDQLLTFLADALRVEDVQGVDQLINSPRVRRGRVVIAVDALDEASDGHARRMLDEVLSPLARTHGVKILVGTRPGVASWVPEFNLPEENVIDLTAQQTTNADIAEYARQRLLRIKGSLYIGQDELARTIGNGIADRALSDPLPDGRRVGSFLVARIITKTLAAQSVIVPEAGWQEGLPSGFAEAFELDLNSYGERLGEAAKLTICAVLEALAWDEGQGVPRRLIPALTQAVTGVAIDDNDIIMVLQHAAGHLLEAQVSGWALYQLYHKRLKEYLRDLTRQRETSRSDGDTAIQFRVTEALISVGAASDWDDVDPYLGGTLAEHARLAGRLDVLLDQAGFVSAAEPSDLLNTLPFTGEGTVGAMIRTYRYASHVLRGLHPQGRYMALQVAAERNAEPVHLPPRGAMSLRWIHSQTAAELQTLTGHVDSVNAVKLGNINGRPVIVSGGTDGTVRIWDLARGTVRGEPLRGHLHAVRALEVGEFSGRTVAISGGEDGSVRIWDAATGAVVGKTASNHEPWVEAVALGKRQGRPVVISGCWDGSLRIWDPASGTASFEPLSAHKGWVYAVAADPLDDQEVTVSGGEDGTVRVWNLASGTPVGGPLRGHQGPVRAIAVGDLDGQTVAVSGGEDGTVRVWNLTSGTPVGDPLRGHRGRVNALAIMCINKREVAVSGGQDGKVRVWDLVSATAVGAPSRPFKPSAMAVGELDGQEVAVSGGEDGTVRVWDVATGDPLGDPMPSHQGRVKSVAVANPGGRKVTISGGEDGTVQVWDLATNQLTGPLRGHQGHVVAVAVGELDGRGIAVSGGEDRTIRVWDLAQAEQIGLYRGAQHRGPVYGIAVAQYNGGTVAVCVDRDGRVRLWDLAQPKPIGPAWRGNQPRCRTIVAGELNGRAMAVSGSLDSTMRVWDLASGIAEKADLPLTGRRVQAVAVGKFYDRPVAILGSDDGTVQIWELGSHHPYATLSVLDQVRAIATGQGTVLIATESGVICFDCQGMSPFGQGLLPTEYDPFSLSGNAVIYDSEKIYNPFYEWRRYTNPKFLYKQDQVQFLALEDGTSYVELRATSSEAVGINFTLPATTSGVVDFEYMIEGPLDEVRGYVTVIPMRNIEEFGFTHGIEFGGDGPLDPRNATSPHRVLFLPPPESRSGGAWCKGRLEFDFQHIPEAVYSVLGARVNEGRSNPGPVLFRLRKVRVVRSNTVPQQ
jgi:WD40 repeat protein